MSSSAVSVSCPGKVILHGEHSVVYGKAAIAISINLRTRATVVTAEDGDAADVVSRRLVLNLPDLDFKYSFPMDELFPLAASARNNKSVVPKKNPELDLNLVAAVKSFVEAKYPSRTRDLGAVAFLYVFAASAAPEVDWPSTEVTVTSKIPIGAGLGSSAAFSVAVSGALYAMRRRRAANNNVTAAKRRKGDHTDSLAADVTTTFSRDEQDEVCRWAFLAEKILHGNPSGIDNSVCTFGGLLSYQASRGMKPLASPGNLRILLINTCVSRNTKALVERVRERAFALPSITSRILEAMDGISTNCLDTLNALRRLCDGEDASSGEDEDQEDVLFQKLEELIDMNQGLLCALGVSHPSLDRIAAIAARHSFHAKLTGAGGGGFAFALVTPKHAPEQVRALRRELEAAGFQCWETSIGGPGVQTEVTASSS